MYVLHVKGMYCLWRHVLRLEDMPIAGVKSSWPKSSNPTIAPYLQIN